MNSFIEKLQKGMKSSPAAEITEEEAGEVLPAKPEDMAEFAAYKTGAKGGAAKKTAGIPILKESAAQIITAENIDEMTGGSKKTAAKAKSAAKGGTAKKTTKKTMAKKKITQEEESEWLGNDGKLAVNVYQTEEDLVIQAAIAGIKASDMDVLIEDEMVTIKGKRPNPSGGDEGDYFIEECHWGAFSRKIILPVEVDAGRADAALKEGVLTIRIPKIQREKKKKVDIKE